MQDHDQNRFEILKMLPLNYTVPLDCLFIHFFLQKTRAPVA